MSDDTNKKRPRDAKRIDVNEDYEVRYWTKALGITKEKLKEVVSKAGTSASAVRKLLGKT